MTEDSVDDSDGRALADAGRWDFIRIFNLSPENAQLLLKETKELVPVISDQNGVWRQHPYCYGSGGLFCSQ